MENIMELDGFFLHRMFSWGSHQVLNEKDHINRINVFPVADGDTGTNMANTMLSMITNSKAGESVETTMSSIAEAVIRGARGNSGLILSEFFSGFAQSCRGFARMGTREFARAAKKAAEMVPLALENPKSGTILTVMEHWAESLLSEEVLHNFRVLLAESHAAAEKALVKTTGQNRVLSEAGVVDAGGYGFVAFLKGCLGFVDNPSAGYPPSFQDADTAAGTLDDAESFAHGYTAEPPEYRYCCETLITAGVADRKRIRDAVSYLGDCLVITGTGSLTRVHIHSDQPDVVIDRLSALGNISAQKVDDMALEYRTVNSRKHSVAIVTDSTCDISPEAAEKYLVHVVPLNMASGNNTYLDRLTIKTEKVFSLMENKKNYPKTAQPSPAAFANLYSFLLTYYDSIISIHLSNNLSGTVQSARKASALFPGKKIDVIDSKTLSGALGLLVHKACSMLESGKSHDEIVSEINASRKKAKIYVSVSNLKYMVRGGRVSPLKGLAASVLNLKPVISVDEEGKSVLWGKSFSRKANDRKIINIVNKINSEEGIADFAVVHSAMEDEAGKVAETITALTKKKPLYICNNAVKMRIPLP